ncbi:MAG: prepilin-type N-terminal cleavage/methylation domain-containing protein [Planctomycetota bacterium]|nr:MAG: prepilin-type N-terminal cleavage/methylation domain-containing protein [Planctomycetota bacterium]
MNTTSDKKAFTLVEILVAMAIILTVISMVYGSYFATSRSTHTYKAKLSLLQDGRSALDQMARQIRCAYVSRISDSSNSQTTASQQGKDVSESAIDYFKSSPLNPDGEILRFVTTRGIFTEQQTADGLFVVTYKFDKTKNVLLLNQEKFIGTTESLNRSRYWQPLLKNVESVELEFFDGQKWLQKWDLEDSEILPYAAKIQISCVDKNYQKCSYTTTAYISCNNAKSTKSDSVH